MSRRDDRGGRGRATRGAPKRRRGRAAAVVIGALALVGLGVVVGVVGVIFGVIPGMGIRRLSADRTAADSAAVDSAAAPVVAPPVADTAPPATFPPASPRWVRGRWTYCSAPAPRPCCAT